MTVLQVHSLPVLANQHRTISFLCFLVYLCFGADRADSKWYIERCEAFFLGSEVDGADY
jgi:hypothetical protein